MQMDLLWVFIILNASPKILWMRVLIIIRGGIKVSQQINYGLDRDFSLQHIFTSSCIWTTFNRL